MVRFLIVSVSHILLENVRPCLKVVVSDVLPICKGFIRNVLNEHCILILTITH